MVEPELAFCDMDALLACAQAYVKHCLGAVLRENASDVAFLERRAANEAKETGAKEREKRFAFSTSYLEGLAEGPWHRVSYTEAVRLLGDAVGRGDASFEFPVAWGSDLQTEHERYLAEVVFGGQPVFVTDYPAAIKALISHGADILLSQCLLFSLFHLLLHHTMAFTLLVRVGWTNWIFRHNVDQICTRCLIWNC